MRDIVRLIFISSILLSFLAFLNRETETWQIILLGITLPLSIFTYLILNPPIIKNRKSGNIGQIHFPLPPSSESDFLLVVSSDDGPVPECFNQGNNKNFSTNSRGLFWINILEKEIGFFSLADISKINSAVINDKKAIIFPKGTTAKLTGEARNILMEFCKKGGVVLLEMPDPSLSELTGVALSDKGEAARRIDWIEPDFLSASSLQPSSLVSMPLNTTIHSIEHKEHDVKTILKIDGKDAILERKTEMGKVVILCFDISLQILSMKQGIPTTDDYRVSIGLNKEIRAVQTSDMAINKEMKRNLIPFADILEGLIMDITLQDSNIPVWWYYPHNFKGASIISFDEDFYGDRLFEAVNNPGLEGKSKSHFIMSDSKISAETIEKLTKQGDEIGIHWNRFYLHFNKFGLHYCRNKTLKAQVNHLKTPHLNPLPKGERKILSCRIHYLKWGNDYTAAFEIMNNADIYLDSSYGPGRNEWGYVFGTGFPFRPLNKDGIPFSLYEFPFHCHEPYGNIAESLFDRLIAESVNTFNTAIVYLFHPYHCKEGGISYNRLTKAMDNMDGKRWVTNFREYMSFYEARKKSSIKSNRLDNKIYIEADVKQDGMGISLRHFQKIKDIQPSAISHQPSAKTSLLSLPKGRHRIEIAIQ